MSVSILPDYPNMKIQMIEGDAAPIRMTVISGASAARCPACGNPSTRICGTYRRKLQELPRGPASIEILLLAHRFRCDVPSCQQHIFCERIPWAPRYQRRTQACTDRILTLAWEMSASAAQRVAESEGIRVTRPTINRLLIRTAPVLPTPSEAPADAASSEAAPLTVIGVDDWAWAKGQRYGTVVVDLITHQPVEVLPDRSAETLARWLRRHPTIRVISRDRGGAYASGAREGAPQAEQVADRFHLIHNWGDHMANLIGPWSPPAAGSEASGSPTPEARAQVPPTPSPQKQARWEAVHRLYDQGLSITAIAEALHCDPATVRKDAHADRPRPPAPCQRRQPGRDDQLLQALWTNRRMTAEELWRKAQENGYAKSLASVSRWLRQRRGSVKRGPRSIASPESPAETTRPSKPAKPWSGRQWAYVLGAAWPQMPRRATGLLSERLARDPLYRKAWTLTRHFHTLVVHRRGEKALAAWCRAAEASGISEIVTFAKTLRQDWAAVVAGVTLEWSQGPVEGFNNRTKLLKRMMYGRAKLPLLRARILNR
ncbi:MAG: hypothetical protein C7B47_15975 [Sulfobacillus thermosulfidooxidans]|uniref:Transposase IS204/IS1001/IS1096/IS1165 DDE domain-containing protein n=1 Tax=Sulfobacillus thermosulfidooxidans TaxID=28034 RepID=A0A2T2WM27_SULTH|nr:MAG: hypothetical protein C7B47_15975 [Sulfobacillus thermosulfidooxidans]